MDKKHLRYIKKPHFDLVLQALFEANEYDVIKNLIRYMQRYGFPISQDHYRYLTVSCAKTGKIQRASSYLFTMKKEHPEYPVTENMFAGHVGYYAAKGLLGYVKYYFYGAMGRHGIKPTAESYRLVEEAFLSGGRTHEELKEALAKESWNNFQHGTSLSHTV